MLPPPLRGTPLINAGGKVVVLQTTICSAGTLPSAPNGVTILTGLAHESSAGIARQTTIYHCGEFEKSTYFYELHCLVQLFLFMGVWMKGRGVMDQQNTNRELKNRIRAGKVRQRDVTRRLAELAFGKANDCVRLALENDPSLDKLDLSLLSEVKRNEKGTVEIKLIDRLRALEQLALFAEEEKSDLESFLAALQGGEEA